jgi:acetylornithine deacetylase/succinyl-diaminopimelate desuccinylase-like protein
VSASSQRVVDLLAELVRIRTEYPPGETTALAALLAPRLESLGYRVAVHAEKPGLGDFVAWIGSGAPHPVFVECIHGLG